VGLRREEGKREKEAVGAVVELRGRESNHGTPKRDLL